MVSLSLGDSFVPRKPVVACSRRGQIMVPLQLAGLGIKPLMPRHRVASSNHRSTP